MGIVKGAPSEMGSSSGRPERVLMTADTVGGVWTYAIDLARALARRGVAVLLATMGSPVSWEQRQEAGRIPDLELHESTFKLEWMTDPWDDVSAAGDWLLRIEEQFEPDLVHLNGYAHGALPWQAPHLVVGHSCVLSWWAAVHGMEAPSAWDQYRDEVGRGIRSAARVFGALEGNVERIGALLWAPSACRRDSQWPRS